MTGVSERETASDSRFNPSVHYVYLLRLGDSSLYVGQTNDLVSRVAEHTIDAGAEATKGQKPQLVWFSHTHDRSAAHQMEQRLRSALQRRPLEVEAIIERFSGLLDLVRPQKTLRQLEDEERAYESRMRKYFHHSKAFLNNPGGRPPTSCGYDGPEYYSTTDWDTLWQMQREQEALESVGGKFPGRPPCPDCLAKAPVSESP